MALTILTLSYSLADPFTDPALPQNCPSELDDGVTTETDTSEQYDENTLLNRDCIELELRGVTIQIERAGKGGATLKLLQKLPFSSNGQAPRIRFDVSSYHCSLTFGSKCRNVSAFIFPKRQPAP